jgi:arylsulfatase
MAIRVGRFKIHYMTQDHEGLDIWAKEFTKLRVPKLFDIVSDPFERGDSAIFYNDWFVHKTYFQYGINAAAAQFLATFREFPPRQKPASFNLDEVMRKMSEHPAKN